MYIVGSHQTKFGISEKRLDELTHETIQGALDDAKLRVEDITAFVVSNNLAAFTEKQCHLSATIPSLTGVDNTVVFNCEAACGAGGVAFTKAVNLLGTYDPIMIIGAEKMSEYSTSDMLYFVGTDSDRQLEQREGLIFPAAGALVASQYMKRHDITLKDLALISLKNHDNGKINPYAHFYGKEVTLKMIEDSPVLCSPLRLFDCSANSDGAVAIIISKKNRTIKDIKIKASCTSSFDLATFGPKDPIDFTQITQVANQAFKQSSKTPRDIDLCEIHDGFSIMEIIVSEYIGIFEKGKSKHAIQNGETARDGKYPINTTGGLKACGHPLGASGLRQIHDIRRQLLGQAGKNQVGNAHTGLAFNFGSIFKSIAVTILESQCN